MNELLTNMLNAQLLKAGISNTKSSVEYKCDTINAKSGDLKYVDCPKCLNKGYYAEIRDGDLISIECPCMTKRRSWKRIEAAGLKDIVRNYTFSAYETPEQWQEQIKAKAMEYAKSSAEGWFFASGTPGSGKTHLCTAITTNLIKRNLEAKYMLWRDEAPRLKALVNDRAEYERQIRQLKNVDVLYIDDFWKGSVTEADINFTFELLNARYNARSKKTIISTEKSIEEILNVDEAIGSRIYERSKGYNFRFPNKNWRLK